MTVKADVEVLKTQVEQIKRGFDDHITQNREDFKEVHSRTVSYTHLTLPTILLV